MQTEAKTNIVFELKLAMRSKEQIEVGDQSQAQSDDQLSKHENVLQTPGSGPLSLAVSSCTTTLRVSVRHIHRTLRPVWHAVSQDCSHSI